MFRDRLAGHVEPSANLAKRLAVPPVQPIQQSPAAGIGQSAKHNVLIHPGDMELLGSLYMELRGYLST